MQMRIYFHAVSRNDKPNDDPQPDISIVHMDRPGVRKVLGDLEAEVMEVMWAWPNDRGATVREVFAVLEKQRPIAYTTVMNTMTRLAKKRLLVAETTELAYVYRPAQSQQAFVSHLVDRIIQDLLVNFTGDAVSSISKAADPEVAGRAKVLLEEIERRKAGRPKGSKP